MLFHGAFSVAVQVPVSVVRHVHDGILVGFAVIGELHRVVLGEGVGDGADRVSRESLVAVRAVDREFDRVLPDDLPFEHADVESVRHAVEVVDAVVQEKLIRNAVDLKCSVLDAVCMASDRAAEAVHALRIGLHRIVAESDIDHLPVLVGDNGALKDRTEIEDLKLHAGRVLDRIFADRSPVA